MMFKPALNLVDFSKQKLASIAIIFFTFGFADYVWKPDLSSIFTIRPGKP